MTTVAQIAVHLRTSLPSILSLAAPVAMLIATVGCDGSSVSPTGPGPVAFQQATSATPASTSSAMTPELLDALTAAYQDENHAAAVYEAVIADFGAVLPFSQVVLAERTHATSIARLLTNRGLVVPANAWVGAPVPRFDTLAAACAAAATAEVDNIALYDRYLAWELPLDVRNVFANNRAASLNGHLPAFSACR